MHDLIVSPFLDRYLMLRPDSDRGARIPRRHYEQLRHADPDGTTPAWMVDTARQCWDLDLRGRRLANTAIVRTPSPFGYSRASYELNLGCNYDCEHCYLGLKRFEGLDWPQREQLLRTMRDAGVVWLQLTGGEPMIDRLFTDVYTLAYDLGMLIDVLSNGSRLATPAILDVLTARRPHRVSLSVYGATEATYDGLTRRKGAFRAFDKGLRAAREAGLSLDLSLIVTESNAHEADAMRALADRFGLPARTFANISPTIYGGGESLAAQSAEYLGPRTPFRGCNAGVTFFHVDPFGKASICKVGREPNISLVDEGVDGLGRLAGIAAGLLTRQGGCAGCTLTGSCGTCMPLAALFRKAKAPLINYCQHGQPKETAS